MYFLVTGTRPQVIKSIPIIKEAWERDIEFVHINTGQHYDFPMYDQYVAEFDIKSPINIHLDSTSEYSVFLSIIEELMVMFNREEMDAVLVPGDTNSALAAALAGFKTETPVCHIESGLRSNDFLMQEEINRRLIDHASSVLFAPTDTAVNHLKSENIKGEIHLTGDTMFDLLKRHTPRKLNRSEFEPFALLTIHRKENVDNKKRFTAILDALGQLDFPIILPIHPRTQKMLEAFQLELPSNVERKKPYSYSDMLEMMSVSSLIITDSGGLQKEAFILNTPCITLRDSTEWTETTIPSFNLKSWLGPPITSPNILVGANTLKIIEASSGMFDKQIRNDPSVYGDGRAAIRIIDRLEEGNIKIPTVKEI